MVQVKLPKPKAILFDLCGTATRESFVEKVLLPYFKAAFKSYIDSKWSDKSMQDDAKALAKASEGDSEAPKTSADDKAALKAYVEYVLGNPKKESKAFAFFRFHVWFDGYENQRCQTPVYSDVAVQMQKWKNDYNINLFVLSNGWAEATKRFMSNTSHGDLNMIIDGHFDTSLGKLNDSGTYKKAAGKIGAPADQILFLTKNMDEGVAAKNAGLAVIFVFTHRRNVEMAMEQHKDIPVARTFTEIEFV